MTAINAQNRNLRNSDTTELRGQQVLASEEPRREEVALKREKSSPWALSGSVTPAYILTALGAEKKDPYLQNNKQSQQLLGRY